MKAAGVLLIVIGLVGLLWGGISWTQEEQVLDVGPVEVNQQTEKTLPIPPIAGAVAVLAGAGVLIAGRRRA
jgi:hypothetical protein